MDDELEKDRFATAASAEAPSKSASSGTRVKDAAIVGPSIHIDGDLRGEEDLLVEGTVNGTVQMRENTLTIGSNGRVTATVYANSVYVDGKIEGDVYGSERVAIRKTGSVTGTIVSPRVSLDDGGYFKGTMEMDQQAVDKALGKKSGDASGSVSGNASAKGESAGAGGSSTGTGSGASSSAESDPAKAGSGGPAAASGSGGAGPKGSGS
jgi:cytoskeletal protein CcmA (bactofilin family)